MAYYYASKFENGGRDVLDYEQATRVSNDIANAIYQDFLRDDFPTLESVSFSWEKNSSIGPIDGVDTQGKDGTVALTFTERPSAEELEACRHEVNRHVIEEINASGLLGDYDLYMDPLRGEYHYEEAYEALSEEEKGRFFLDDEPYPCIEDVSDFREVEKTLANDRSDLDLSYADLDFARESGLVLE